jgi:bifunctional NMN adenylyltransferase/nudix hydrolase
MIGVFIGRFQPVHDGHLSALAQAASRCSYLVILMGSANSCRSTKNPWTYRERFMMVSTALRKRGVNNFKIFPINDYKYNDPQWISDVRETVEYAKQFTEYGPVTLFGHWKEGNEYLKWFPDWKFQGLEATVHLNATQVREKMWRDHDPKLPESVRDDFSYYVNESIKFKDYPFPETLVFSCGDAVVECQGHVALIQRKFAPGKGTWALPGGFRNRADPTTLDCAIRELQEETGIKVPEKVLRGSIVGQRLFDDNSRSQGIPRTTLAVYIRIHPDPDGRLPKLKPEDDAQEAEWFPLNDVLNKMSLYDDHKDIISTMTGVQPRPAYVNIK